MSILVHLLVLALGKTTPLFLTCSGGLLSEVSGVINFALEGMMLFGAFTAVWVSHVSGSAWLGLLGGAAGGMILGSLHALASLRFRANQIVSSIAVNLLAVGLTGMLLNQVFHAYGTSPTVPHLPNVGEVLALFSPAAVDAGPFSVLRLSVLVPLTALLAVALFVFFSRSKAGLHIRACGENPFAAEASGLAVVRIRFLSVLASGALAGLGGAYLSIGTLSQFVEHMTHGRGYLAIAALILGRWRPAGILLVCLLFGLSEAVAEWLSVRWAGLAPQAFLAFPYVLCMIVLLFQAGQRRPPSSLGKG